MTPVKKKAIYPQLFWIGNVKTHPTRELLCTLAEKDKRIKAIGMNWNRVDKQKTMNGFDTYVSLPDHCQYKYLIDMMGRGWSARTKILMFSGRPLFIQDRKWTEYWYKDIKPFVHYIPVKADLSDLSTQISWAESHQQEAQQIAINAQKFACEYLTREAAINYLKNALIKYINGDCSLNKSSN